MKLAFSRVASALAAVALVLFAAPAPAASTTVVISQVDGGGGGSTGTYKFDYVELYNLSASPQVLTGWSLQYGSATGNFASSASNLYAFPAGTTIQPGHYLLVQLGPTGSAGVDFPVTADLTTPNLTMSGLNGKVALASIATALGCGATATPCTLPSAQIVDLVAWGTSNDGEGGTTVNGGAALTSSQGGVRKSGGCQDTDNNNTDFNVVTAPVPRNSSSPVNSCSAPIVPTCPPTLSTPKSVATSTGLSAIDTDNIVNGATITSAAVPGIALSGFTASPGVNQAATVSLGVDGTTVPGTYPVTVHWVNDGAPQQSVDCTVNVSVVDAPIVPSCPSPLSTLVGFATSESLTATDADNIVNGATITSITPVDPGLITLSGFTASPVNGAAASATLNVGAGGVPVGTYVVTVQWTNDGTQTQNCAVEVDVLPANLPIAPTCNTPFNLNRTGGSEGVSATDPDGTVTGALLGTITPTDPGSISLTGCAAAGGVGGTASCTLHVAPGTAAGSYSVPITWSNNDVSPQTATCTVSVVVTNGSVVATTCPARASGYQGFAFTAALGASDIDGRVSGATAGTITPSDPGTISITNLVPATNPGDTATADLSVGASTAPGTYTVPINWTNDETPAQSATCTVTVVVPLAIHTVQGSGTASPYIGAGRTVRGIVTAILAKAFYLQSPEAYVDGDPNSSEGIYVYVNATPPASVVVGNDLTVTGTVSEYRPASDPNSPTLTELGSPSGYFVNSTSNPLPTPATITAADTLVNSIENLEKYEGMRVTVPSMTVIAPTQTATQTTANEQNGVLTSSGVFYGVVTGVARPFREAGIEANEQLPSDAPGGLFIGPGGVPRFDFNPERIRVNTIAQTGGTALDVVTGAALTNVTGVLDYVYRTYAINTDVPGPTPSGGLTATPATAPASGEVTIATMNLQHFYDSTNDGDAPNEVVVTPAVYQTHLAKVSMAICNYLRLPDVVAVQEMEHLSTLQALAAKIAVDQAALGRPDPQYVAYLVEGNDPGGIDVGFLVKTAPVAGSTPRVSDVTVTQYGKADVWSDPCPSTAAPYTLNDRPPLGLTATVHDASGMTFPITVLDVHPMALGTMDDVTTTGCSTGTNGNRLREKRRLQAESLAALIQARQGQNLVVLGDFNSYEFNDGFVDVMGTVMGATAPATQVVDPTASNVVNPLLTLLDPTAPADQRYSFSYDGSAQSLDHVVVNASMVGATATRRMEHARVNVDFPGAPYRYDSSRVERYSDHDPAIAYFTVQPGTAAVSGGGTVCAGQSTAIQAALTGHGPWTVTWSDGITQSGVASSPATRNVSPSATTTYTVTALSDAYGPGTFGGSAPVTVNSLPATPTASSDGPVCAGSTLHLSTPAVSGASYSWTGPNGFTSLTQNPSITGVTTAASGTYSVTITDATTCTSLPGTVAVVVNADTLAPVVTAPGSLTVDQSLCCSPFGGASGATNTTLSNFINGGSATDDCTASPTRLAPQVSGADVTSATCFQVGSTSVTFRYQDTAGHTGTASSSVTVRMFGDLDMNHVVDPSDMVVLRAYFNFVVAPGTSPFNAPLNMADLTHNTIVDPADMVILRAYFNFVVGCLAP